MTILAAIYLVAGLELAVLVNFATELTAAEWLAWIIAWPLKLWRASR